MPIPREIAEKELDAIELMLDVALPPEFREVYLADSELDEERFFNFEEIIGNTMIYRNPTKGKPIPNGYIVLYNTEDNEPEMLNIPNLQSINPYYTGLETPTTDFRTRWLKRIKTFKQDLEIQNRDCNILHTDGENSVQIQTINEFHTITLKFQGQKHEISYGKFDEKSKNPALRAAATALFKRGVRLDTRRKMLPLLIAAEKDLSTQFFFDPRRLYLQKDGTSLAIADWKKLFWLPRKKKPTDAEKEETNAFFQNQGRLEFHDTKILASPDWKTYETDLEIGGIPVNVEAFSQSDAERFLKTKGLDANYIVLNMEAPIHPLFFRVVRTACYTKEEKEAIHEKQRDMHEYMTYLHYLNAYTPGEVTLLLNFHTEENKISRLTLGVKEAEGTLKLGEIKEPFTLCKIINSLSAKEKYTATIRVSLNQREISTDQFLSLLRKPTA